VSSTYGRSRELVAALGLITLTLATPSVAPILVQHHWNVTAPTSIGETISPFTPATLSVGATVGTVYDSPFYAVNFGDDLTIKSQLAVGAYFNSTPFSWFRLAGGGDDYDPTIEVEYVAPASGVGTFVPSYGELTNFTWFKSWCLSLTPHCAWMTYLPGEENNTAAAVHVAKWFHTVLKFVPTMWEFGNEPNAWEHFGLNRTKWSTSDALTPTGLGYATMVKNYITAISAIYPSDQYLGIQMNCACGSSLIQTTAQMNGAHLAGMAYHNYPWLNDSSISLSQFFGALQSFRSIYNTSVAMETRVTQSCSACAAIPISIGEYNAGPVPDHSPFAQQYWGAVFIAASVIQALQSNISQMTFFDLGWLINTTNGQVQPEGLLYQRVLSNLTMGDDYPVTVNALGVGGVYGLVVQNGTRTALFIVNTNVTKGLALTIPTSIFGLAALGSWWTWGQYSSAPVAHQGLQLPTSLQVPRESILLMTNY